jgi:hypothetical protein
MPQLSEYARRCADCLRLAEQVESAEARAALVDMAAAWLLLEQKSYDMRRDALSPVAEPPPPPPRPPLPPATGAPADR